MLYFTITNFFKRFITEYKTVSKEVAASNRYYGLGGWLMFFYIMIAIGGVQSLVELSGPPDPKTLDIGFGGDVSAMRSSQIWNLVTCVSLLVITPIKHPFVPKIWIGLVWIGWIVGFAQYAAGTGSNPEIALYVLVFLLLIVLAMTWYFINSKRANVTYRNRVPVDQVIGGYSVDLTKHKRMVAGTGIGTKLFWFFSGLFALIIGGILIAHLFDKGGQ